MKSTHTNKTRYGLALGALALLPASTVHADEQVVLQGASLQTRSRAVPFQDLNPMTEDGARTLYNRLSGAARHVCGTRESRDLVRLSDWKSCYSNALDQAINDLNHPLVNALHAARDGARTRNHFAIPSGNFGRPSTAAP